MDTTNELQSRKRKLARSSSDDDDVEGLSRQKKKQRTEDQAETVSSNDREEKIGMEVEYIEYQYVVSYLPPEILFKIFNSKIVSISDLHKLRAVCSSWNECLKDEEFAWKDLCRDNLRSTFSSGLGNRVGKIVHYMPQGEEIWKIQLFEGETLLGESESNYIETKHLVDIFDSDIYSYEFRSWENPNYRNTDLCWMYSFAVRINFVRLERLILNNKAAPINLLTAAIIHKLKVGPFLLQLYDAAKTYNPDASDLFVTEQPADITGITLHKYQIKAINWMVSREKEAHKDFAISPLLPIGRANMYLHCTSTSNEVLYLDSSEQIHKYNMHFKSKGGIIADEMGLGKTVEVIGLVLKLDVTPQEGTEKQDKHQTKATLIVCPNHLVAQWNSEIEKYCGTKLNVLMITTIVQVKKYTSQDIIDADIVLITYNLLSNKNYEAFKKNSKELRKLNLKGVILEQFHWHRLVVDEGHEQQKLPEFTSTYCWYMTGTPFVTGECLAKVRSFLGLALPVESVPRKHHMLQFDRSARHMWKPRCSYERDMLDDIMINNCLWRNTKASTQHEYELLQTRSKYMLFDFNPLEKIMYRDFGNSWLHVITPGYLCNHSTRIKEGSTLTELFVSRMNQKRTDIKNLIARCADEPNIAQHFYRMIDNKKQILEMYEACEVKPVVAEEDSLEWLIERFGTKLAQLYIFLKELFESDDEARALIFSADDKYLAIIKEMLEERGIYSSTVKGNVHQKSKGLNKFKDTDGVVRVALLNTTKVASGMNLIEADHVIFMDVCRGSEGPAHEAQAISRAYRHGQTKQVTVVRFVINDTADFDAFRVRCPDWANQNQHASPGLNQSQSNSASKAVLVRSSSFGVLLANSQ